jgi:hypothetical protein
MDLTAFYERISDSDNRYSGYSGLYGLGVTEVENFVVKDINVDFRYLHAKLICKVGLVVAHEQWTPYTNYSGDFDFEYNVGLSEVIEEMALDITLKHTREGFEDLELNSCAFAF